MRIYLWYLIQKKIYKFYSRIYDTIKFFAKLHKKLSNSQRKINVFLHIFYAKWRKRLDERWISSECIKLNSKTSIQYINNVLPDSLRTGLYAGIYDAGSENAPSDYGMVMYLSYTYDTNKWYTAIASATNNEGVFVSTKTNGADWNGWRKLSTN